MNSQHIDLTTGKYQQILDLLHSPMLVFCKSRLTDSALLHPRMSLDTSAVGKKITLRGRGEHFKMPPSEIQDLRLRFDLFYYYHFLRLSVFNWY